ncbi:radical SAM protein [Xenorhabdus sp. PB30.3]|uniref:radical SAM protein n=1 Tax=Xenorhabdus sp. PB30.3 TaxID=2788941 RepID=UPI001E2B0852|nr:radical SAM protein [Xenorhabdus sp. PB30.3]MCC8380543.1 radical SAM protein [Xenorhabdus sp. PB30.3]
MIEQALYSLNKIDEKYPRPDIIDVLSDQRNQSLLSYVYRDPFGCHIFPGDIENYPHQRFLEALNSELSTGYPIHLWAYIPTCRYICHFCQFPKIVVRPHREESSQVFKEVVDLNIMEARMWLQKVPNLASVSIGEFNIFGGTPSLLPFDELERLMVFYREHFNFSHATLRFEGEPGTLDSHYLAFLHKLGFSKLSFGAQSFNDDIIYSSGRKHSSGECFEVIKNAREAGIEWTSVDLIYGLLQQRVEDVEYDIRKALELELSHIVCSKLHIKDFMETRTGVSEEKKALWQKKIIPIEITPVETTSAGTNRIDTGANKGSKLSAGMFPSLGEQYQMRNVIDNLFDSHYSEHPTMYFYRKDTEPEKWKGIITDQDKQHPEVAIGLGGSSKCRSAEMVNLTDYKCYREAVNNHILPVASVTGMSAERQESNAIKMALSTCQPVNNDVHRQRFGHAIKENKRIYNKLCDLAERQLLFFDNDKIKLTHSGKVLVESIVNTEFND